VLLLSAADGTVVHGFALHAGFCLGTALQGSRKGLCLLSATCAVVFRVGQNSCEGKGKQLLETWAGGRRADAGTAV